MARDVTDDTYYVASGGKIPVKWTAPEVTSYQTHHHKAHSYDKLVYLPTVEYRACMYHVTVRVEKGNVITIMMQYVVKNYDCSTTFL